MEPFKANAKYPAVTVEQDLPTNCLKIAIATSSGTQYHAAFAMEQWAQGSVYEKIHMVQKAFNKWTDTNPQLNYALNLLRAQIIQEDKFSNSQVLMVNNMFSEHWWAKDKYAVIWQADYNNPCAEVKFSPPTPKYVAGAQHPAVTSLPGLKARVKNPITGTVNTLQNTIITLNDVHRWTREQIADWLETLDVDIRFKTEGGE